MNASWESVFATWSSSPPDSEQQRCERLIFLVKEAISKNKILSPRSTKTFVQGSYRNRVNIRKDSDVDVGVVCDESYFSTYPEGKTRADFGGVAADYTFAQFKKELYGALVEYFGEKQVQWGNKAFKVTADSGTLTADVVPFFEYRRYWEGGHFQNGVALIPDKGFRIVNYPERLFDSWPDIKLHYEEGVLKNDQTGRRFKGTVRILKNVRAQMEGRGYESARQVCGYLLECLVHNVPNNLLTKPTWCSTVEGTMNHIWTNIYSDEVAKDWMEVDRIKYLFRPSQPWTTSAAFSFITDARDYLGIS